MPPEICEISWSVAVHRNLKKYLKISSCKFSHFTIITLTDYLEKCYVLVFNDGDFDGPHGLFQLYAPLCGTYSSEDPRVKRIYHISFEVVHRSDFFENNKYSVHSYVVAECPYQALFQIRHRMASTPWVSNPASEAWELLNLDQLDRSKHKWSDIMDAVEQENAVINLELELSQETELAASA